MKLFVCVTFRSPTMIGKGDDGGGGDDDEGGDDGEGGEDDEGGDDDEAGLVVFWPNTGRRGGGSQA